MDTKRQPPEGFPYMSAYLAGKPKHEEFDDFYRRHPPMDLVHRAKIFRPFTPLKGQKEAMAAAAEIYTDRPEPDEEEKEEINRRLIRIRRMIRERRMEKEAGVRVTVCYFEPCRDRNHEAYGRQGKRRTISGICGRIDGAVTKSMTIGQKEIRFQDLISVQIDEEQP